MTANQATKTPTAAKKTNAKKAATPTNNKKLRVGISIAIEILILAATLINTSFAELPYRLILPFVLGLWTIFIKYRNTPALLRVAIVESIFMGLELAANLLPLYWRLGAFFLLGVRSIFIRHFHRAADDKACHCGAQNKSTRKKDPNHAKEKSN